MKNTEEYLIEMLENINWLLEAHGSHVELVEIIGRKIALRYEGRCSTCNLNCAVFILRMMIPDMEIIVVGNG